MMAEVCGSPRRQAAGRRRVCLSYFSLDMMLNVAGTLAQ